MSYIAPIHSTNLINFSFGPISLNEGLPSSGYITFTRTAAENTSVQDAGGQSTFISALGDKSGTIEFNLLAQSEANLELMELVRYTEEENRGIPIYQDFTIETGNTLFLHKPVNCWIQKVPDQTIQNDMNEVVNTWEFKVSAFKPFSLDERRFLTEQRKNQFKASAEVAFTLSL